MESAGGNVIISKRRGERQGTFDGVFSHRVSGESDRRRLPGDAEAGAVGGGEAVGGGAAAAGGDGHRGCGLEKAGGG